MPPRSQRVPWKRKADKARADEVSQCADAEERPRAAPPIWAMCLLLASGLFKSAHGESYESAVA